MKNGTLRHGVHPAWLKLALLATGILLVMTLLTLRGFRPSCDMTATMLD